MRSITPGVFATGCVFLCFAGAAMAQSASTKTLWKADVSKATIPERPAAGRVHGQKFVVEKAEVEGDHGSYILHLEQGKGFFADKEFQVSFLTPSDHPLSGSSFTVHPGPPSSQPGLVKIGNSTWLAIQSIQMKYKVPNAMLPMHKVEMYDDNNSSLHLQFGKVSGNKVPGKIYLAVGDKDKSFVAGTFTAVLTKF